mmetsp:Transcript_10724/g.30206  ORF Transcript_10724/g.30206 Transcript_10724/m.30206 type:complete len:212 (-) Transcript_10724:562-1197(-)
MLTQVTLKFSNLSFNFFANWESFIPPPDPEAFAAAPGEPLGTLTNPLRTPSKVVLSGSRVALMLALREGASSMSKAFAARVTAPATPTKPTKLPYVSALRPAKNCLLMASLASGESSFMCSWLAYFALSLLSSARALRPPPRWILWPLWAPYRAPAAPYMAMFVDILLRSSGEASGIAAFTLVSILFLAWLSIVSYLLSCWSISIPTSNTA